MKKKEKIPDFLTQDELDTLLGWPTPAISNAIELFDIKLRNEGFMLLEIQCRYPQLEPMQSRKTILKLK